MHTHRLCKAWRQKESVLFRGETTSRAMLLTRVCTCTMSCNTPVHVQVNMHTHRLCQAWRQKESVLPQVELCYSLPPLIRGAKLFLTAAHHHWTIHKLNPYPLAVVLYTCLPAPVEVPEQ